MTSRLTDLLYTLWSWGCRPPPTHACIKLDTGASILGPLKAPHTPFYVAARDGHPAVVDVLLKAGADINGYDVGC